MSTLHVLNVPGTRIARWHRRPLARKFLSMRLYAVSSPPEEPRPRDAKAGSSKTEAEGNSKTSSPKTSSTSKESVPEVKMQIVDGAFSDYRWVGGKWDLDTFKKDDGSVDWDTVIDAEIARRQLMADTPVAHVEGSVLFDTAEIPWWAWVRRFHLPVAEKLNGRAAMVGYALAIVGEQLSGAGLLEQQNSFFGKLLLHIAVFAILLVQDFKDIKKYRDITKEAFFYDQQWAASWIGKQRPSESEKA